LGGKTLEGLSQGKGGWRTNKAEEEIVFGFFVHGTGERQEGGRALGWRFRRKKKRLNDPFPRLVDSKIATKSLEKTKNHNNGAKESRK